MNKNQWRSQIISSLGDMADGNFQRRAWTGAGPEVSSMVEIICRVFDDALLTEYVKKYEESISYDIITSTNMLDYKIKMLDTEYLDKLPISEAINSSEWIEIRSIAESLRTAFDREEQD